MVLTCLLRLLVDYFRLLALRQYKLLVRLAVDWRYELRPRFDFTYSLSLFFLDFCM
jgi:hypothetical protein